MLHRVVACRDAMRYPTTVVVEVAYAATSNTEIMHRTCRDILFIERMNASYNFTRPVFLA